MQSEKLHVALNERSYPIIAGSGVLEGCAAHMAPFLLSNRVIIITDENVAEHQLQRLVKGLKVSDLHFDVIPVPPGEASKSLASFAALCEMVLELRPDRKTTIVAFGGGVVGDLAGFVASSILRGVPFIQIPTTLLAQVDSSVGGKTGLNTAHGKNLVGAFYQPQAVLIDTDTLHTLPDRELRAGYAEVVKYGVLGDAEFFDTLEAQHSQILARDADSLKSIILKCCAAKAEIVSQDEREKGTRALLNLGHTFAHALEAEAGYDGSLLHGEAVSIGMVMAAELAHQLGHCDASVRTRLEAHLQAAGCPVSLAQMQLRFKAEDLLRHFSGDKKNEDGQWVLILPTRIGDAQIVRGVAPDAVKKVLEAFIGGEH